MPVNREHFDVDRERGNQILAESKSTYESEFKKTSTMSYDISIPMTFVLASNDPNNVKEFIHCEVKGFGPTIDEAIADWTIDLATKPQSGKHLFWRVIPNCDWSFDFASDKVIWKVYARFSVDDTREMPA